LLRIAWLEFGLSLADFHVEFESEDKFQVFWNPNCFGQTFMTFTLACEKGKTTFKVYVCLVVKLKADPKLKSNVQINFPEA